jgi:hypothetical protein
MIVAVGSLEAGGGQDRGDCLLADRFASGASEAADRQDRGGCLSADRLASGASEAGGGQDQRISRLCYSPTYRLPTLPLRPNFEVKVFPSAILLL